MLEGRDELIAAMFRETDRVQRMKTALAVILFGIDGWADWRERLEKQALQGVERELAARTVQLLRCYDVIGRYREGEFGLVLPGATASTRLEWRNG